MSGLATAIQGVRFARQAPGGAVPLADGAYQQHADGERGALTPGRLADIVVLAEDVLEIDDDALHALTPVVTMLDGEVVHDRRAAHAAS